MKLIIYGFSAIITLIVVIATLGTLNSFVKEVVSSLSVSVPTKVNYCIADSDCVKNPNNCTTCISQYASPLGLMQPCQGTAGKCACRNNKCLLSLGTD